MHLVVRVRGAPRDLAEAVTRAIWELVPDQPVTDLRTVESHIAGQFRGARMVNGLFAAFALLALALAAAGVFGVVSYAVAGRTRELGVRIALGARRRDVLRMFLCRSLALILAGAGLGLLAAAGVGRLLESLLYGVGGFDALTFGGAALGLVAVALAASFLPAWRASRVEAVESLRWE